MLLQKRREITGTFPHLGKGDIVAQSLYHLPISTHFVRVIFWMLSKHKWAVPDLETLFCPSNVSVSGRQSVSALLLTPAPVHVGKQASAKQTRQ